MNQDGHQHKSLRGDESIKANRKGDDLSSDDVAERLVDQVHVRAAEEIF